MPRPTDDRDFTTGDPMMDEEQLRLEEEGEEADDELPPLPDVGPGDPAYLDALANAATSVFKDPALSKQQKRQKLNKLVDLLEDSAEELVAEAFGYKTRGRTLREQRELNSFVKALHDDGTRRRL